MRNTTSILSGLGCGGSAAALAWVCYAGATPSPFVLAFVGLVVAGVIALGLGTTVVDRERVDPEALEVGVEVYYSKRRRELVLVGIAVATIAFLAAAVFAASSSPTSSDPVSPRRGVDFRSRGDVEEQT